MKCRNEAVAMQAKTTWKQLLARGEPLLLPAAHDALCARLIERAGFSAYTIGGYALVGSRYALPDIGLVAFGEMSAGMRDVMSASSLPVLVDGDDGYGDAKNVARTIQGYEAIGASAIFLEDQKAPKRCGHMAGKDVIDADAMVAKLRAAVAARQNPDLFIIARTDARAGHGLDEALRRGERDFATAGDRVRAYRYREAACVQLPCLDDSSGALELEHRLMAGADEKVAGVIAVKIRYPDFETTSRQTTVPYTCADDEIIPVAKELFNKLYKKGQPVRLMGVRLSELTNNAQQTNLFDDIETKKDLYKAIDDVKNRFGKLSVKRASSR